uniref:Uncharacterized protein n=1 Tax=Avena sativa TaxID=4498 RepID=A0ACD5XBX1_AVESA
MASSPPPPPRPRILVPKPDPDAPPPIPLTPDLCAALRRKSTKPDPGAAHQDETTPLTAELCAALRRELEPSPEDHSDFAHRLRLDDISAPLPPPPPASANPARASSSAARTRGKKGTRGAEIVRATLTADADHLSLRDLVRRARLTFEALRGRYVRAGHSRGDMRALTAMLASNLCLYRDVRIVGAVPGVLVGDAFSYRAELIVVGLHSRTQAAIGFVPASLVSEGHPVATSIVSSGEYLDDRHNGELLVYTGSGGRPWSGGEQGQHDRGNLALSYSCKYGVEVRVIRCHDCNASPSGKLYIYDGVYKVESSTYGPGKSGREVNLVRLPGQDPLGSNAWRDAKKLTDALDSNIRPPGYLTLDLSRGKEAVRIPVCNTLDQDRSPLDDTEYLARPELPLVPPRLERPSSLRTCACKKRNGGGGLAYNSDGMLVRGMPVVYECGALCGCPASCPNRVTQRGMTRRLEVFRSKETEWGVRALELIQPGAFICEFSGDLVAAADVDGASTDWNGYADPRKFPARWKEWGDFSAAALPDDDDNGPPLFPPCPEPAYVLDVSKRRNLASYICHSTVPNSFVQLVVRGDESDSCPHLAVFAMENIPPMCELSIDYGID